MTTEHKGKTLARRVEDQRTYLIALGIIVLALAGWVWHLTSEANTQHFDRCLTYGSRANTAQVNSRTAEFMMWMNLRDAERCGPLTFSSGA